MTFEVIVNGRTLQVELTHTTADSPNIASGKPANWTARIGERELRLSAVPAGADTLSLLVDGRSYEIRRQPIGDSQAAGAECNIFFRGTHYTVEVRDPRALRSRLARHKQDEGPRKLLSPMPGKVIRVLAPQGSSVAAGQPVLVIEAMKMQNEIKSPKAGRVQKLLTPEGTAVNAGDVLAIVE